MPIGIKIGGELAEDLGYSGGGTGFAYAAYQIHGNRRLFGLDAATKSFWTQISGNITTGTGYCGDLRTDRRTGYMYALWAEFANYVGEAKTMLRSVDGGVTWTVIWQSVDNACGSGEVEGVCHYCLDSFGNIYALAGFGYWGINTADLQDCAALRVYKSTDGGDTWNLLHADPGYDHSGPTILNCTTPGMMITVTPSGQRIYVQVAGPDSSWNNGLPISIFSDDFGVTWTRRMDGDVTGLATNNAPSSFRDNVQYVNNGRLAYFMAFQSGAEPQAVYVSDDDGITWATSFADDNVQIGAGVGWRPSWGDNWGFWAVESGTPDLTRLFITTDNGDSFTELTPAGIPIPVFADDDFVYDPATHMLLIASLQPYLADRQLKIMEPFGTPVVSAVNTVFPTISTTTGVARGDIPEVINPPTAARVADAASREAGELAIILTGADLVASVYYTADVDGDGSAWRRCVGAPVRDDGTWIVPDLEPGKFLFGFHDDKIWRGDVAAGVMTASLAPATLSGDLANHAVWMGTAFGGSLLGGSYLIAAEDGIYQTWDRGETIELVRPATGFPALPGGAHPKMLSLSLPQVPGGSPAIAPPVAPPATMSDLLALIIGDMTAAAQGHAAGTEGYDWEFGNVVQSAHADANHPDGDGWAMLIWDEDHDFGAANTCVEVLGGVLRYYVLVGATWTLVDDVIYDSQENDANFGAPIYGSAGSGPKFTVPHARGVQFYNAINSMPAGVIHGCYVVWQGRLALIDGGQPDDRDEAFIVANAGADWRDAGDPSDIQAAGVGRLKRLTNDYQTFAFTTLSAAQLTATPPPNW